MENLAKEHITLNLRLPPEILPWVSYTLDLFADFAQVSWKSDPNARKTISVEDGDLAISRKIVRAIQEQRFDQRRMFDKEPLIFCDSGQPDFVGTCFYMVNCLQEYNSDNLDAIGRFRYDASYQHRFDCIDRPLVNEYFLKVLEILCGGPSQNLTASTTKVIFTHDIDYIKRGKTEDVAWLIKQGKILTALRLLTTEYTSHLSWANLEEIAELEKKHGVSSIYFLLTETGKSNLIQHGRPLFNADYDVDSPDMQEFIQSIIPQGFDIGLHKSLSPLTFSEEANKFARKPTKNRNHYLRFNLPGHFADLDKHGIKEDYSLGFAEHFGFRNSFGLPFHPYNLSGAEPYRVLMYPLNIMDTTFRSYLDLDPHTSLKRIEQFLVDNSKNCVISILWHNNYFTGHKFAGWKDTYESILLKCKELNLLTS